MRVVVPAGVLAVDAGAAGTSRPLLVRLPLVVVVLGMITMASSTKTSARLLVAAVPFMQPFVFGGYLTPVAIILSALAALTAFIDNSQRGATPLTPALRSLSRCLVVALGWSLVLVILHPEFPTGDVGRSAVSYTGVALAAIFVLRDDTRRALFVRWLLGLVIAVSACYTVSLALWVVIGPEATRLPFQLPMEKYGPQPMYFPLTPAAHGSLVGGTVVPRWQGLGREPGVMALLSAWSIVTAHRMDFKHRWIAVLAIGLIGAQSTAGFAVCVGVFVLTKVMMGRNKDAFVTFARWALGLVVLGFAVQLAIVAPVIGVAQHIEYNPGSSGDRLSATLNGLDAIVTAPLGRGEQPDGILAGINVVAGTAIIGIPGTIIALVMLVRPWTLARGRRELVPGVLLVAGTVMTAQPLGDSTAFIILLAVAVSALPKNGKSYESEPGMSADATLMAGETVIPTEPGRLSAR